MLEKTEQTIKKGQSGGTGNIGCTRHRTKTTINHHIPKLHKTTSVKPRREIQKKKQLNTTTAKLKR
jgi:hypothetical protein